MRATDHQYSAAWIEAVFIFADADGDDCATYDEMINIYNWASQTLNDGTAASFI